MAEMTEASAEEKAVHSVVLNTVTLLANSGFDRRALAEELVMMGAALMAHVDGPEAAAKLLAAASAELSRKGFPQFN